MSDFLLRDVDPAVMKALRALADEHRRSLQAEIQTVLEDATSTRRRQAVDEWWAEIDVLRQSMEGRDLPDMVQILREEKDRR
jgi:plasmid stability protein